MKRVLLSLVTKMTRTRACAELEEGKYRLPMSSLSSKQLLSIIGGDSPSTGVGAGDGPKANW
jgi:hypothetical protein